MPKKKVTTPEEEGVEPKNQDPTVPTSTSSEDTPEVVDETTKPAEEEQEAEATDEAIPSTDDEPEPKPTSTPPGSEEATPSEQSGDKPAEEGGDPEATEKPAEGADTSGETSEDGDPEDGAARDEEKREEPQEYEEAEPSALSDIAHQVLRDYDLKVVFLTTDGTAFYGYSDALNYARTLADETVHHFFRTPPTDDELRQLLPHNLLPEHLQTEQ